MEIQFSVFHRELSALAKLTNAHTVLSNVLVEVKSDKIIMIATDGKRMAIQKSKAVNNVICRETISLLVPVAAINALGDLDENLEDESGSNRARTVSITYNPASSFGRVMFRSNSISFTSTDARLYPTWRSVLPSKKPTRSFTINSDMLSGISRALSQIEYDRTSHFTFGLGDDKETILISNNDGDFIGVIGQILPSKEIKNPDWIQ